MEHTYLRGDVFYADLGEGIGSEQSGYRPVVIIQNNIGNKYSPTVIVAAITSRKMNRNQPTHYHIEALRLGAAIYNPFRAAQNRGQAQTVQVRRAFAQAPCGGLKPRPGGECRADTACAGEPDPLPLQDLCG